MAENHPIWVFGTCSSDSEGVRIDAEMLEASTNTSNANIDAVNTPSIELPGCQQLAAPFTGE